jgi:hypothetical protein
VPLKEFAIGSTDPNIPIANNCTDAELHFRIPGGSSDFEDEGDESNDRIAIPTARWPQRPATYFNRVELGTCVVHRYEGEDGEDADADADEDEQDESSQVDDGSMQNVED